MMKCNQRRTGISLNSRTISGDVITSWPMVVGSYPAEESHVTRGGGP